MVCVVNVMKKNGKEGENIEMTKTITMDYDEFVVIKEKAEMNQAAIDKKVNKQMEKVKKEYKELDELRLKHETNKTIRELLDTLDKRISKEVGRFGYVEYSQVRWILSQESWKFY